MPKPKRAHRGLHGTPAHQRLMLSDLTTELFAAGRVITTEDRARKVRPLVEKVLSQASRGDTADRRREVSKVIRDDALVHVLFTRIAPNIEGRPSAYIRITRVAPRKGDNAAMAIVELMVEGLAPRGRVEGPSAGVSLRRSKWTGAGPRGRFRVKEQVPGLATGEPLGGRRAEEREASSSAEELTLSEHSKAYSVGATRGFFQRLVNDEYVHAERQSSGALSLMWSCAEDVDAFLRTAGKAVPGLLSDSAEAVWSSFESTAGTEDPDEDAWGEHRSVTELLSFIGTSAHQGQIAFCSIRFGDTTVVWQAPFKKAVWTETTHAQAALVSTTGQADHFDVERTLALLAATGTSVVRAVATEFPARLDEAFAVVA